MKAKLILKDGSEFEGTSFGSPTSAGGEVVFSTGMVGYPESLTDPSYKGQILILTYPLIGNYGVPEKLFWESERVQVSGLVVSNYIGTPSHFQSKTTLAQWFIKEKIPLIEIKGTRLLTQKIRKKGTMLGKIIVDDPEQSRRVDTDFYDPNKENLVEKVSVSKITQHQPTRSDLADKATAIRGRTLQTIVLIDCGAKQNIIRSFLKRGIRVIAIPWDLDPFSNAFDKLQFDALVISNGPGDPKKAKKTILTVQKALAKKIPTLGICLGHQLLALAGGGDTKKLKFGHRSQNQPCMLVGSKRCFITTQNHGFSVSKIPRGFKPWFINANDQSNEGLIHDKYPFMSVQFHPEATPGPVDTEWVFDYFLKKL